MTQRLSVASVIAAKENFSVHSVITAKKVSAIISGRQLAPQICPILLFVLLLATRLNFIVLPPLYREECAESRRTHFWNQHRDVSKKIINHKKRDNSEIIFGTCESMSAISLLSSNSIFAQICWLRSFAELWCCNWELCGQQTPFHLCNSTDLIAREKGKLKNF